MALLDKINSPEDIRKLNQEQLKKLAQEIRSQLIATVSKNGGHLAPNLGVVELTLALHKVFNTPRDKLVWDVGHQSYVHKLLTGRREDFHSLRKYGGLSGFPKPLESPHDAFATGHSSTSLSVALGLALARDIKNEDHSVVAIIGDGAMTGGMAFEAMNHAGHLGRNLIVILNDNEMSIAENVGGMARYLSKMRTDPKYSKGKEDIEQILRKIPSIGSTVFKAVDRIKDSLKYLVVPGMFFEELGFTYLGPIEGHNVKNMVDIFKQAKNSKGPVLVHVITRKGKGYLPAEENPDKFHGIGPFDIETGQTLKTSPIPSYTEVFGRTLNRLADKDQGIIAITAAMPSGTGLTGFAKKYPQRFFDVGIAEQHAVTMAAAMAKEGLRPVVAIYSTFLQRAYDQVLHDVCLQSLPVTFAIDRGGLVGDDGPTHHGVFDLSFLSHMPNMTVMAPKDENELQHMLATALKLPGPAALRYPRGSGRGVFMDEVPRELPLGRAEIIKEGGDVTFLALGPMVAMAQEAASMLAAEGIQAGVINARFIKPLDEECIIGTALKSKVLVTVEENVLAGGFGSAVLELLCARGIAGAKVLRMGFGDCFMEHGDREILLTVCNLNAASLAGAVLNSLAAKKNTLKFKLGFGTGGK